MREYVMQDWNLVIGLVVVMLLNILCQLMMIYHMNNLIKEREKMSAGEKEKIDIKCKQSGGQIHVKRLPYPLFTCYNLGGIDGIMHGKKKEMLSLKYKEAENENRNVRS